MNGPFSRIIDGVVKIATNLGGTISTNSGNRLADAIEVIADKAEDLCGGGLPVVTATDNGKILKVASGKWQAETNIELPAVTADDNGKILTVVNGVWTAVDPSDSTDS